MSTLVSLSVRTLIRRGSDWQGPGVAGDGVQRKALAAILGHDPTDAEIAVLKRCLGFPTTHPAPPPASAAAAAAAPPSTHHPAPAPRPDVRHTAALQAQTQPPPQVSGDGEASQAPYPHHTPRPAPAAHAQQGLPAPARGATRSHPLRRPRSKPQSGGGRGGGVPLQALMAAALDAPQQGPASAVRQPPAVPSPQHSALPRHHPVVQPPQPAVQHSALVQTPQQPQPVHLPASSSQGFERVLQHPPSQQELINAVQLFSNLQAAFQAHAQQQQQQQHHTQQVHRFPAEPPAPPPAYQAQDYAEPVVSEARRRHASLDELEQRLYGRRPGPGPPSPEPYNEEEPASPLPAQEEEEEEEEPAHERLGQGQPSPDPFQVNPQSEYWPAARTLSCLL